MRPRDQVLQPLLRIGAHAQLGKIELAGLLVEQAQHHAFAAPGRNRRHAHVDRAAGHAQADAAILRQAPLGDVELGHDLDAADHRARDRLLRTEHFTQHAVDAETHHEAILVWLDVDVGRAFLDRLGEQRVDEADDRRIVVGFEQILRFGQLVGQRGQVEPLVQIGNHRARIVALLVQLAQQALESGSFERGKPQRCCQMAPQFGQNLDRDTGPAGDLRMAFVPAGECHAMSLGVAERRAGRARGFTHCREPSVVRLGCAGAPSSVGLARKSCTSGSIGRSERGVIGQSL